MKQQKPRDVILLSGGRTTQALTEKLLDRFDVAILDPNIAEAHRGKHGEQVIGLQQFVDQELQLGAANVAMQMSTHVMGSGIEGVVQRLERVPEFEPYRGNGLIKRMETWFPMYFYNSAARQIARNAALDRLANNRKIVLAVTHEDVTETYGGMTVWAKTRGIKTLHIPHGNSYQVLEYMPDLHGTSICDAIAATPYMENFYRARGYTGEIFLTGTPLFDRWTGYNIDRAWAQKCLQLDAKRPVVVYKSSWGQRTNALDDLTVFQNGYESMLTAMKELKHCQLIISIHPGEVQGQEEQYCKRADEMGIDCLATRYYPELILSAADIMVSLGPSNFITDASFFDLPSVSLNIVGFRMNHPAITEIEIDPQSIKQTIVEGLANRDRWNTHKADYVYQMAYQADGKSSDRIAEWIKCL